MLTIILDEPALEQWLADRARVEGAGIDHIVRSILTAAAEISPVRSDSPPPASRVPGPEQAGKESLLANTGENMEETSQPSPWKGEGGTESVADGDWRQPEKPGGVKKVEIFTDGACTGNPGKGGYGVILKYGSKMRELSGGYRRTTNNRMELMAAITGLQSLRYRCQVTLYTDSQYVANGITRGWARGWRARGWRRSTGEPAINPDLWSVLLDLCDRHDVRIVWIKGHAGHVENERCDRLSVAAAAGTDLPPDIEYEKQGRRGH